MSRANLNAAVVLMMATTAMFT